MASSFNDGGRNDEVFNTHTNTTETRSRREEILLIGLDTNVNQPKDKSHLRLTDLLFTVENIKQFSNPEECVNFLSEIENKIVLMILSGNPPPNIMITIQDVPEVHSVFIFCENSEECTHYSKQYSKVKGVFTRFNMIIREIKLAVWRIVDSNNSAISLFPSDDTPNPQLDKVDRSFIYTQTLKEILKFVDDVELSTNDFLDRCADLFSNDPTNLEKIKKYKKEPPPYPAISLYANMYSYYSPLNDCLRTQNVHEIIKRYFIVHALHKEIQKLYDEQFTDLEARNLTVYRGQAILRADIEKLEKIEGGLMSFNCFLSTSEDLSVALMYAADIHQTFNLVPVIFIISIDSSLSTIPYADIRQLSKFSDENEILFSEHSIFSIEEIEKPTENFPPWRVKLKLVDQSDHKHNILIKMIRADTQRSTGWNRLIQLFIEIGEDNNAEELYKTLNERASDESDKAILSYQFALKKNSQEFYEKSMSSLEKLISPLLDANPRKLLLLSSCYNNIGALYCKMGKYVEGHFFYDIAIDIYKYHLPAHHQDFVIYSQNIGYVYEKANDYFKALVYHEEAVKIYRQSVREAYAKLAGSHADTNFMYMMVQDNSTALLFAKKTDDVDFKILRRDHPLRVILYERLAEEHDRSGDHQKSLSYYKKIISIKEKYFRSDHPDLADTYDKIGSLYQTMGDYPHAQTYHEKALDIKQQILSTDHSELNTSYRYLSVICEKTGNYSKNIIRRQEMSQAKRQSEGLYCHSLAICYNNKGLAHYEMGEYSQAVSCYEKAIAIHERTLRPDHPDWARTYNNMGCAYRQQEEYQKSLLFHQKALQIEEKVIFPYHPALIITYKYCGDANISLKRDHDALHCYEEAVKIARQLPAPNH